MNLKRYRVPSKSQTGKYHIVEELEDDKLRCDCRGWRKDRECRHCRIVRWWKREIKGNPEYGFYSHDPRFLQEHHLLRGAYRKYSMTIWLTYWVHELATLNDEFATHLMDLFIININKIMQVKFKATVKEVSIKNLVSGDKGLRVEIDTKEIEESMKLAQLTPEKLVKVTFKISDQENIFYASVGSVEKTNLKKKEEERSRVILVSAPAEIVKIATLGVLPIGEELVVEYKG